MVITLKLRFHFAIIQNFTLFSFLLGRRLRRCETVSALNVYIDSSLVKSERAPIK